MDSIEDIREEVNQYLPKAGDEFLIRVYAWMLQEESGDFTDDQLHILRERRKSHLEGESPSYSRAEASQRMRDLLEE